MTFYVGASIHREITNDYTYTGAPFLMGTVALGNLFRQFLYKKEEQKSCFQLFMFVVTFYVGACIHREISND